MARLNEPPVSADSLDALRRRFLRQNRDIARINSNQSLRIRALENECARLLSENLDFRGQVLRLEKELDDSKAQRIGDHALLIKEKMEAHLVELGALLAGFGVEPPKKQSQSRSPSSQRRQHRPPRLSLQWQRKSPPLSPREAESLAAQEGRLAPIYEDKTYPRRTMNREELLSLQADAADAANSPELGPPPISRLFRDESRRSMASPSKFTAREGGSTTAGKPKRESCLFSAPSASRATEVQTPPIAALEAPQEKEIQPLAEPDKKPPTRSKTLSRKQPPAEPLAAAASTPAESTPAPAAKAGSKRKFAVNDENAAVRGIKAGVEGKDQAENRPLMRELKNPKSIRELSRKDKSARKPLAIKSTNDDMSSPRKRTADDDAACKGHAGLGTGKNAAAGRMRAKMQLMVDEPEPQPPNVVDVSVEEPEPEPEEPAEELADQPDAADKPPSSPAFSEPVCPNTPTPLSDASHPLHPSSALHGSRDTPPPSDISSLGEMSRPSRRARASVSYAEPNLRDKMRRPTKELFDAVAGEGRYRQRQLLQGEAEDTPAATKHEEHATDTHVVHHRATAADKRKRASSAEPAGTTEKKDAAADPYEFTVSPPSPPSRASESSESSSREPYCEEDSVSSGKGGSGSSSRSSSSSSRTSTKTRRASAAAAEGGSADRHTKPSGARKRASIAALKKAARRNDDEDEDNDGDEEDDPADSSYEPPTGGLGDVDGDGDGDSMEGRSLSTRDRISRRRSMML